MADSDDDGDSDDSLEREGVSYGVFADTYAPFQLVLTSVIWLLKNID